LAAPLLAASRTPPCARPRHGGREFGPNVVANWTAPLQPG